MAKLPPANAALLCVRMQLLSPDESLIVPNDTGNPQLFIAR